MKIIIKDSLLVKQGQNILFNVFLGSIPGVTYFEMPNLPHVPDTGAKIIMVDKPYFFAFGRYQDCRYRYIKALGI